MTLPAVEGVHPLTAPLVLVVTFYRFVEALARRRGFNPDTPPYLRKVTETVMSARPTRRRRAACEALDEAAASSRRLASVAAIRAGVKGKRPAAAASPPLTPSRLANEGRAWADVFVGAAVFDGARLHAGAALVVEDGRVAAIVPPDEAPAGERVRARAAGCWRRGSSTCR